MSRNKKRVFRAMLFFLKLHLLVDCMRVQVDGSAVADGVEETVPHDGAA